MAGPEHPHEALASSLTRLMLGVTRHARRIAREQQLTLPQLWTMRAIVLVESPTPAVVADHAQLSRSTMTSVLDRLEKRGLLERRRSTSDRRRVELVLTPQGQALAAQLDDPLVSLLEPALAGMSQMQQRELLVAVERLTHAVEERQSSQE